MSELGTTNDPVALIPGSYAAAHKVASAWRSRSEAATALRDGVRGLEVDSAWTGYPYEKYLERAEYVRSSWQRCGEYFNALINHPDILLELLGGVALVVGGGTMIGGGGALAITGVGGVPGAGLAWAGVGVAGAGLAAAGHAGTRWMNEATGDDAVRIVERPPPHPEHGGRDIKGHWNGDGQRPWVDTEKIGLDRVADRRSVEVIHDKVRATIDGYRHKPDATSDQHRYYDGLYENADGTYTGIEVKGGTGSRDAAQKGFDSTVSPERPATATLNGKTIQITRVVLETVK